MYDRSRRHLLGWLCGRMAVSYSSCVYEIRKANVPHLQKMGFDNEVWVRKRIKWQKIIGVMKRQQAPLVGDGGNQFVAEAESTKFFQCWQEICDVLRQRLNLLYVYIGSGIVLFTLQLLLINKSGAGSSWLSVQAVCSGTRPT